MEKYTNNAGDGNELLKVLSARDSHSIYRYAMERSSQIKLGVHAEQESRAMDKSQRMIYVPRDQWRWTIECEQIIEVHDIAQAIDCTITMDDVEAVMLAMVDAGFARIQRARDRRAET